MREKSYWRAPVRVPDVRTDRFTAEAHRQSALVAAAGQLGDDQDFIEAVSASWDE